MDKGRTRAMRWKEKRVFLIVSSSGKDNFSYKNTRFTVSAGLVIRQERNYQWMTSSMMLFLARQCREIIKLLNFHFIDPRLNESLKGRKWTKTIDTSLQRVILNFGELILRESRLHRGSNKFPRINADRTPTWLRHTSSWQCRIFNWWIRTAANLVNRAWTRPGGVERPATRSLKINHPRVNWRAWLSDNLISPLPLFSSPRCHLALLFVRLTRFVLNFINHRINQLRVNARNSMKRVFTSFKLSWRDVILRISRNQRDYLNQDDMHFILTHVWISYII